MIISIPIANMIYRFCPFDPVSLVPVGQSTSVDVKTNGLILQCPYSLFERPKPPIIYLIKQPFPVIVQRTFRPASPHQRNFIRVT